MADAADAFVNHLNEYNTCLLLLEIMHNCKSKAQITLRWEASRLQSDEYSCLIEMSSFAIIYCYLIRLHIGRFVSLYQRKLYYNLILGTFTESTKSKEEKSVSFVVDYRQKCISNIKRPIKTIIHFHGCFCCCCCCCCVLVSKRSNYFNNLIVIGFIEIK